jgi:hypothetical protein
LKGARSIVTTYYKQSVWKPEPTFDEKRKDNNKIIFYDVPSDKMEAYIIADMIEKKIKSNKVTVIIPNGNYFPPVREALKKKRIAYNYKTKIDEHGITRFVVLVDWTENPENNLLLRYLTDLIIENNDQLMKTVYLKINGLREKRNTAAELMASLWQEVDTNNSLYKVICNKATQKKNILSLLS